MEACVLGLSEGEPLPCPPPSPFLHQQALTQRVLGRCGHRGDRQPGLCPPGKGGSDQGQWWETGVVLLLPSFFKPSKQKPNLTGSMPHPLTLLFPIATDKAAVR